MKTIISHSLKSGYIIRKSLSGDLYLANEGRWTRDIEKAFVWKTYKEAWGVFIYCYFEEGAEILQVKGAASASLGTPFFYSTGLEMNGFTIRIKNSGLYLIDPKLPIFSVEAEKIYLSESIDEAKHVIVGVMKRYPSFPELEIVKVNIAKVEMLLE